MLYLRSHHPQLVYISFCPFFKSVSSQSESGLFFICPSLLFSSSLCLCPVLWLCCCWVGLCFYQMSAVVHCGFTKAFW